MEIAEHVDQMVLFSVTAIPLPVEAVQRRGCASRGLDNFKPAADESLTNCDARPTFLPTGELPVQARRDPSGVRLPASRHHAPQFLQRATTMAPRGADDDFDD